MNYLDHTMLASLPMYDMPEIRDATDGFWAALAKAYGVTGSLTRADNWSAPWDDPALLFSQTCGYPFTHAYDGILKYVATPHYDADGCDGPNYCSIVFARSTAPLETFRGAVAAYNSPDSMSGMLALKLVFAHHAVQSSFFSSAIKTGSHAASLAAVQSGLADVCAADCVTVALLRRYRPEALGNLVEIARSPQVPGLPFVTRCGDVEKLRKVIRDIMQEPVSSGIHNRLLFKGISVLQEGAYEIIREMEQDTNAQGLHLPAC